MAEYLIEIEGKYDLDQITKQVRFEEAGASEFVASSFSYHNNNATNIATFREADAIPPDITLIPQTQALPAGARQIWSGVMMVSGALQLVVAYR
jgi:hypothetical protein